MPSSGPSAADDDQLVVDVQHQDGDAKALVAVRGEVDVASVDVLAAALDRLVDAGATHLRLDLSGVPFMDSTGLTALLAARSKVLDAGGSVVVESASPPVRRTFDVAGLDAAFGTA